MQRKLPNKTARATDDLHMQWVKLRSVGLTSLEVASIYGVTPEAVRIATGRIRKADEAEAMFWGDDPNAVAEHYWDGQVMAMRGAINLSAHYGKGRMSR